jgi:pentatricopeptide repeat protein
MAFFLIFKLDIYCWKMFICRSCWTRTLGALRSRPLTSTAVLSWQSIGTVVKRRATFAAAQAKTRDYASGQSEVNSSIQDAQALTAQKEEKRLNWITRKQLEHLHDPYHIAQHVEKTLGKGAFDEAVHLVRQASRDMSVTVSWNHLIDYLLKQQRLHAAIKLFNEVRGGHGCFPISLAGVDGVCTDEEAWPAPERTDVHGHLPRVRPVSASQDGRGGGHAGLQYASSIGAHQT